MLTPFALESLQAIDHHWHKPMFVTVGDTATWWQGAVGALILQLLQISGGCLGLQPISTSELL